MNHWAELFQTIDFTHATVPLRQWLCREVQPMPQHSHLQVDMYLTANVVGAVVHMWLYLSTELFLHSLVAGVQSVAIVCYIYVVKQNIADSVVE